MSLNRILELRAKGSLPPSSDFHGPDPLGRVPTVEELRPLEWWVSGGPDHPSAYMATRTYFDLPSTRDCLEIVGIDGSPLGVARLMQTILDVARLRNRLLMGNLPTNNPRMARYLTAFGFTPDVLRYTMEPHG